MSKTARYLIMLAAVCLSWLFVVSRPLRQFAEAIHDAGHSIGALIAGSGLEAFGGAYAHGAVYAATPDGPGWFRILLAAATAFLFTIGLAWLLLLASTRGVKKFIAGGAAIVALLMSYNYGASSQTLFFAILFSSLVIFCLMVGKDFLFKWMLEILAFALFAFVVADTLVNDLFVHLNVLVHFVPDWSRPLTDSEALEAATGVPSMVWSAAALLAAFLVFWSAARMSGKRRRAPRGNDEEA